MKKIIYFMEKFQNIILLFYPFLLSKNGGHTRDVVTLIFVMVTLIYIFLNKRINKIPKDILLLGLGYLVFLSLSYIKVIKYHSNDALIFYKSAILCFLFAFCIVQVKIKETLRRYILPLISIFSLYPIYRAMKIWSLSSFSMEARLTGNHGPSVFAVELGIFTLISMIVLFYESNKYLKIIAMIACVLGGLCIFGTQTRSVVIIMPMLFLVIVFIKNYKQGIVISIILLLSIIGLIVLNSNSEKYFKRFSSENLDGHYSSLIRVEIYKRTLNLGVKSNFMGIGFLNYKNKSLETEPYFPEYIDYEKKQYIENTPLEKINIRAMAYVAEHSHNNFLEVLITQGIFAFIFYIMFIICITRKMILNYKNELSNETRSIQLAGIMILIFICLNGLVDTNLYMTQVNQSLFLLLGLCLNRKIIEKS